MFLLVGMAIAVGLLLAGLCFLVWALGEHSVARKYRGLVAQATKLKAQDALKPTPSKPAGDSWTIEYKEGRTKNKVTISGKTEAEALAAFARSGARYDAVLGVKRS